jgi:hypothetical protein
MANIGQPTRRIHIEPMPVPEESPIIEPAVDPAPISVPSVDPELVPA